MLPFAIENVNAPVVTLTVGSPNRCALAGVRNIKLCPLAAKVAEPSERTVNFEGPDKFSVMAFPVLRFVNEALAEPVKRRVMDPSETLRTLPNFLLTTGTVRILNPHKNAGSVNPFAGIKCHLSPRARAGAAVSTPPNMPSNAPSATITPSRLIAIPFRSAATARGQRRALSSSLWTPVNEAAHLSHATSMPDQGWRRVHRCSFGGRACGA